MQNAKNRAFKPRAASSNITIKNKDTTQTKIVIITAQKHSSSLRLSNWFYVVYKYHCSLRNMRLTSASGTRGDYLLSLMLLWFTFFFFFFELSQKHVWDFWDFTCHKLQKLRGFPLLKIKSNQFPPGWRSTVLWFLTKSLVSKNCSWPVQVNRGLIMISAG